MNQYSKYINGGEELWYIYHQHLAPHLWKFVVGGIFVFGSFFFLWPLFQMGAWGVGLFIFGVSLGVWILLKASFQWRRTILLITNERFLDVHRQGIWYETVSQLSHSSVVDVSWSRKGLWAIIFRYGTVVMLSASNVRLSFSYMKSPSTLADLIIAICRQNKKI